MSKSELHPTFKVKKVYNLECLFCGTNVCRRGMKAILLADTNTRTEMFSTDVPEKDAVDTVGGEMTTNHCACIIQHFACVSCGNEVGYTVSRPCLTCMMSCNNGHLWMYFSVRESERVTETEELLLWGDLPRACDDIHLQSSSEIECFR